MWCRDDMWRQAGGVECFSCLPPEIQNELEGLPPQARPDIYASARQSGKDVAAALEAATSVAAYLAELYAARKK